MKEAPRRPIRGRAAVAPSPAVRGARPGRFAILAGSQTPTNLRLVGAARALDWDSGVVEPKAAQGSLALGDVVLGRLDVLPTLDGPEPGLRALRGLEEVGVIVLNRAGALLAAHDKLATALRLAAHGLPHPRTAHVDEQDDPGLEFPVVVKPRFGSWGRDVQVCESRSALRRCLRRLSHRSWFRRQGVLVQELVPTGGTDLRIIVAAGEVVGAVERVAAPGEWRTNVELGGRRRPVVPASEAKLLALGAAHAIGADLVGVDLLPEGDRGWTILELNGAVDFTTEYSLDGSDVFKRAVDSLGRFAHGERDRMLDGEDSPMSDELITSLVEPAAAAPRLVAAGGTGLLSAPGRLVR
jgi:ribosomal protein S6--L-glutamate ligase